MFFKSAAVIVAMTLLSVALLDLRHRRLDLVYEMATTHRQLDHARKSMWDTQTQIAHLLVPKNLEQAIDKAQLQLEPAHDTPANSADNPNEVSEPVSRASSGRRGQPSPPSTGASR